MEPIFESQFEPNSFGFRPNKSPHDAVGEIVKCLNFGCEHVIDADLTKCFDNIDKRKLMQQVANRISDGSLLHLIRQFLDTGIIEDNEIHSQGVRAPTGFTPIATAYKHLSRPAGQAMENIRSVERGKCAPYPLCR